MNIEGIFSKKYIKKYKQKIKYLGPNSKLRLNDFLFSRLIIELLIMILTILIPKYGIIIAILSVLLFHFLYTVLLIDNKIRIRSNKVYVESILFFNMLKLSLNQNNDLKDAIEDVSKKIGNSIALEFRKVLKHDRYNNDINEVLNKVIETIPNNDVKNRFLDLKESNNYQKTLTDAIIFLEEKNTLLVKKQAYLKPIVISVYSLIFISIICILLFNIYNIVDKLSLLIK